MARKRIPGELQKQAVELVLQGHDDDKADLEEWLKRSPDHVDEYLRAEALWQSLADPDLATEIQAAAAGRSRPWSGLIAAVFVLASIAAIGAWHLTRPEVHRTAAGAVKSVQLDDRSVVFLNSDSNVEIDYTRRQRRLVLVSGEATFEVAKSRERPFIVECGSTRVIATGTEFAVRYEAGETTVTVIEGHVVVENEFDPEADLPRIAAQAMAPTAVAAAEASEPGGEASKELQRLTAGLRWRLRPESEPDVATFEASPVAWRPSRLVVDTQPLGELVATFNRLNVERIELDRALRQRNVSGVFDSTDPSSLLGFLEAIEGVVVETRSANEIFVRMGDES
ncbi:MAG: FecR domain-containing protein [Acidobacteriota bacterium]